MAFVVRRQRDRSVASSYGQNRVSPRKTGLLDWLRGQLNPRQEKAVNRMLREGPEGFKGDLSAGNYAAITGASPATTTRDLADLVEKATSFGKAKDAMPAIGSPFRSRKCPRW